MSYTDTISCFEQFFNIHWTLTPIYWTNIVFDPPRDASGNASPYVALTVRENAAEDITLGSPNPQQRVTGTVIVQIFTLERSGRAFSAAYADIIKGMFRPVITIYAATDISVLASDHSFNSVTTDFLTQGVVKNLSLPFLGFSNVQNNGSFTVSSVTQRKIVVTETTVVDEAAGSQIQVYHQKHFSYRNSGLIRPRPVQIVPVGVLSGWFQTNVIIPYTRDTQS